MNRLLVTQPESRLPSALHVAEALQPFCEGADLEGLAKRGLHSGRDGAFDVSVRPAEVGPANPQNILPQSLPHGNHLLVDCPRYGAG